MIYLDTSVVLAHLLAEDRTPPPDLWAESLVSSRLLQYEAWTRLHGRGLAESHGPLLEELLGRVALLQLAPPVLQRALEPFPKPVRTSDAMHLSSLLFLHHLRKPVRLASYDARPSEAAALLGLELAPLWFVCIRKALSCGCAVGL